jgi:hypothetical protein
MADKKKQTTLTLSFRDDELWIYDEIARHSAKGGWVKDVLAEYIRSKEKPVTEDKPRNEDKPKKKKILNF